MLVPALFGVAEPVVDQVLDRLADQELLPQALQSMLEAASVVLERERVDLSDLVWVREGDFGSAASEGAPVLLRGGGMTCEVLARELAAVLVLAGETGRM